jgi:hypothetical protein
VSTYGRGSEGSTYLVALAIMKFTYLVGAGASANVFPVNARVSEPDTEHYRRTFFNELDEFRSNCLYAGAINEAKSEELQEIINNIAFFGTPDLCSKFYLESGQDPRNRSLITLLSNYFTYKQKDSNRALKVFGEEIRKELRVESRMKMVEARALRFLISVANEKKIPKNLKILSWNYDRQLEIAAAFLARNPASASEKIEGFTCWPNVSESENLQADEDEPFLHHLNGVAGYYYTIKAMSNFQEDCYDFTERESLLSFAWDHDMNSNKQFFTIKRLRKAIKVATGTDILVIIGYSFPYFNRNVDRLIFEAMAEHPLKKIYFQDPYLNGDFLRERFGVDSRIPIKHVENADNYFIPSEF